MNITFLIGNGFDLKIGMKTKYVHFYEYYSSLSSDNEHHPIKELKDSLIGGIENWSDFELQFGRHCKRFKTFDEFETVFDNVSTELAKYIEKEQNKYNFEVDHKLTLYKSLATPEQFLPRADKEILQAFKSKWDNYSAWNINIITFNYSTAMECLLGKVNPSNSISVQGIPKKIQLAPIKHIHGYTNDNMVLGVNDLTQIDNGELKNNPYFLSALVKPECNKAIKHLIDKDCEAVINNSNLICLFGLSIGDTDKIWWEIVGNCLTKQDARLVVFSKGDKEIPALKRYKVVKEENAIKEFFLSKTDLTDEQKRSLGDKIFVGYNTDIFDITLEETNSKKNMPDS